MIKKYKLDAYDSLVCKEDGYLVYYEDYQALEAENTELKAAHDALIMLVKKVLAAHIDSCDFVEVALIQECEAVIKQAKAEAPDEWIPVSERLPEVGLDVLTAESDGEIDIIHLDTDGLFGNLNGYTSLVTHWMPLPLPPKEKE